MPISFGQFIVFISKILSLELVKQVLICSRQMFVLAKFDDSSIKLETTVVFGYKSNLQKYQVLTLCHWIKQRLTSNV